MRFSGERTSPFKLTRISHEPWRTVLKAALAAFPRNLNFPHFHKMRPRYF
jgi:hypothetical protein